MGEAASVLFCCCDGLRGARWRGRFRRWRDAHERKDGRKEGTGVVQDFEESIDIEGLRIVGGVDRCCVIPM